jgi:membrane protease YdiL (CAAX protease family)
MSKDSRRLAIFFGGTFAWTWSCYFAIVALHLDPYRWPGLPLLLAGGSAPTWMGIGLAMMANDRAARREFWRRSYDIRRIGPGWLAVIVLLFPALTAAAIGVDCLLGGTPPGMDALRGILHNPLLFFPGVLLSFFSGPFSEEFGWRGFALDPLLRRLGFAGASVVLGLIWGVWHLPLYFMPETWHGQMGFRIEGFWAFVLGSVGLAILASRVYLGTAHSILAAMLVHLSANYSTQLIAGSSSPGYSPRVSLLLNLALAAIGLAICVWQRQVSKGSRRVATLSPQPAD